jgi:hypothetical protein
LSPLSLGPLVLAPRSLRSPFVFASLALQLLVIQSLLALPFPFRGALPLALPFLVLAVRMTGRIFGQP